MSRERFSQTKTERLNDR